MNQEHFTGLTLDALPQHVKTSLFNVSEIGGDKVALGEPTLFRPVKENEWLKYSIRTQGNSGSCVANTVAKMLEIMYFKETNGLIKFSHAPIYINRINRPGAGMVGVDAMKLACLLSSCKETDMPSEGKDDKELDGMQMPANYEDLNNLIVPTNYAMVPINFNVIANNVHKYGSVMIWVNTDYPSWCKDIPSTGGKKGSVVHSVTAIDSVTVDGVQYIVIEDSWGRFGKYSGQRLITKEFFDEAVWFAAVLTSFKYKYTDEVFAPFTANLQFGDKSEEVARYQRLLKARGLFPFDAEITGFYGPITAKATYDMQVKLNVAPLSELNSIVVKGVIRKGGRLGPKTLKTINTTLLKNSGILFDR